MLIYLIPVFALSLILIFLIAFYIVSQKAALERLNEKFAYDIVSGSDKNYDDMNSISQEVLLDEPVSEVFSENLVSETDLSEDESTEPVPDEALPWDK